jgi:hypothetical protein
LPRISHVPKPSSGIDTSGAISTSILSTLVDDVPVLDAPHTIRVL